MGDSLKPISKTCISRVAKDIAAAIAEAGTCTPDEIEQIVHRAVGQMWRRRALNYMIRRKTQMMIKAVYRLSPNKIRHGTYFCREIGCDVVIFKYHMERQFTPEMNWQNYADVWEIDHIKPLRAFNLLVRQQYLDCSNYTNLRPLLRHENRQWSVPVPVLPLKPYLYTYD